MWAAEGVHTFPGVKDLKEGKFAIPKMVAWVCLEKGPQTYLDENAKQRNTKTGEVCKIAVTKGKLGEKEFSVRRVYEKTLSYSAACRISKIDYLMKEVIVPLFVGIDCE